MPARIYKPARNAMQSGTAKTRNWVLEYVAGNPREVDPLMGWTSSGDTQAQVRLTFDSREAAEAYAEAHGIDGVVQEPKKRKANIRPRGYGENFATDRRGAWTHYRGSIISCYRSKERPLPAVRRLFPIAEPANVATKLILALHFVSR